MTIATSKLRILGKPKPPQTGEFSSKVVKEPAPAAKKKLAKKSSRENASADTLGQDLPALDGPGWV